MSGAAGGLVVATMSGAEVLGLIVSALLAAYLIYALLRGERF